MAMALVLGARVPQYVPGRPTFTDVRDDVTRLFVESVQAAPGGPLFPDAPPGNAFRPHDAVTRLTAAVALVRAAGLRRQAESGSTAPLAFLDVSQIPTELRGYVSVATSVGLLQSDSLFRPDAPFTRADLARAIATLERQAVQ
jgi:hypothetical protein